MSKSMTMPGPHPAIEEAWKVKRGHMVADKGAAQGNSMSGELVLAA